MKTIKTENKIAIFLDHRALINSSYTETVQDKAQKYELKSKLFDFQAKATKDNPPEPSAAKAKRKRKAAKVKEYLQTNEHQQLQVQISAVLQQLQQEFPKVVSPQPSERIWEEPCEFPQFNGANATTEFQTVCFNKKAYLIPPDCRFFNYDVTLLAQLLPQLLPHYDLIVIDPPWRNKYIRRLKRARIELAYSMLDNAQLQQMPLARLVHQRTIVAIWCTNAEQHQQAVIEDFLPAWNLRLLHTLKWFKLNTDGELISQLENALGHNKQPFEILYIACHKDSAAEFNATPITEVDMILSVPSIVHSHKPPLLPWLKKCLPDKPQCLEIFARYLQPQFTSVGLEVLKLMDKRLYDCPAT